jgi:radical SAM superfamily enzyme YgiQ (UPF0313 family)
MSVIVRFDEKALVILESDREWLFAADPAGRLAMVHKPDVTYKRSRYNRWYRVDRSPWPALTEVDATIIADQLSGWVEVWKRALQINRSESFHARIETWIHRFLEHHAADGARFSSLYGKIPILPPDDYQALYVRIHRGCPWNRCSFCSFYKEERYEILSLADLSKHFAGVREYWGSAVRSRHGIFLGDANAVAVPAASLAGRLGLIRTVFPERELREIHSFVDYFAGPKRDAEDFRLLRELGLRRLSLGIESGDPGLMKRVDKPMEHADVIHLVDQAHAAGIPMNLIFLVGLGGKALREAHHNHSMKLIKGMTLSRTDRIYLSPLVVDPDQPYPEVAEKEGWESLDDGELLNEMMRWQSSLRALSPAQVSPYHIRQFLY